MPRTTYFPLAILAALALTLAAPAQPDAGKAAPATVEQTMEAIEAAMDTLDKSLDKPEALRTLWDIQRLALHAKSLVPEHLKGGATPENLAGFRRAQIELMKLLLQLESNLIDARPDEARKTIDAIDELREASHKKFKGKRE